MEKKPLKERFSDSASVLFIIFILFYGLQGMLSFFWDKSPPFIDFFTVTSVLIIIFIFHLKFRFRKTVPICIGIGSLFHIVGLYKIIPYNPYYIGTLYGAPQLNYHYDWIVHSVGFAFYVLAFSSIIYPYFKKTFNKFTIFFLILFFMLGLSALHEVIEFAGYTVFGYGQGFLEFGEGDISPDTGPWRNACMDLISNIAGGIVAAGCFLLIKKYHRTRFRK